MTARLWISLFLGLVSLACPALAQVTVDIRLEKRNYLAGESIPLSVTVTNLSGQELAFQGTTETNWIDFMVNSTRGVPLTPLAKPAFGAVRIPTGKALTRTIDLAQLYALDDLGNFSVYAIVRLPGQGTNGFQSNRHLFTVNTSQPYWKQVVGAPGKRGGQNEFRLIQYNNTGKNQLYAQLADARTGKILRTHYLGDVLMLRKPSVTIDSSLNMHVLFMMSPKFWGHATIAPDGRFLGRELYQPAGGDPVLAQMTDGSIKTLGGILYDRKAAEEARKATRKASDRPAFLYE
ncbi:hypothetical protein HNR46_000603 [Haloferula luteola]|uniref:Uncharacterized protein n=1 Tax=Haloferula luteola TaxID=595692 RepID=A0A840V9B6_9BACT|nr:hypothetical protein [Haloferula luteola]MBB5350379.1 hypothetical protein [Haloferula luteola]